MESEIKADLFRHIPKTYCFRTLMQGIRVPGFFYMFILRKAAAHKKYSIPGIFYRMIHRRLTYKYGIQIPVSTKISEGFYIGHFGTLVISSQAIIGKNCNIAHGVTIGRIGRGNKQGTPKLGNRVWIGTNAIIVGGIFIGDEVMIAPGAFINFDVPSNSIVIGNPGKIIPKEHPTENYILNTLN